MSEKPKRSGKTVPGFTPALGERIKRVIELIGTQKRAAELVSVRPETVAAWQKGEQKPPFLDLLALCQAAGVSINWLATGEEGRDSSPEVSHVLPGTHREQTSVSAVIYTDPSALADDAMVLIPLLDVQPSAGSGTIVEAEAAIGRVAFDAAWLRSRNITPQAAHVLTARGDSMEPTIRSGDTLIVDTAIIEVVDSGIYVIAYSDMLLVKRLHRKLDGSIVISSDNRVNAFDETVPPHQLDTLRVAGRVMWYGRII